MHGALVFRRRLSPWRRGRALLRGARFVAVFGALVAARPAFAQAAEVPDLDLIAGCPDAQDATAGETVSLSTTVKLRTQDNPIDQGVQAWTLSVAPLGRATVKAVTIAGTAGAPALTGGFEQTESVDPLKEPATGPLGGLGPQGPGAVNAVVLSLTKPVALPKEGEEVILAVDLDVVAPAAGCRQVGLGFKAGLQGSGQPILNKITWNSKTRLDNGDLKVDNDTDIEDPCLVQVCVPGNPIFQRGNCDGALPIDLTDAVVLLQFLFQSGRLPDCLKACDVDDDGDPSLTDAVVLLTHLFRSGVPPKAPYPECGTESTPDTLPCATQLDCAP